MTSRERPPNRRWSETFTLELHGLHYVASFSRFDDGRIAEVFLQSQKPASQSDFNARDSAIAASLSLQYGCPLDVLRRALLRDAHGNASTPLGHEHVVEILRTINREFPGLAFEDFLIAVALAERYEREVRGRA